MRFVLDREIRPLRTLRNERHQVERVDACVVDTTSEHDEIDETR